MNNVNDKSKKKSVTVRVEHNNVTTQKSVSHSKEKDAESKKKKKSDVSAKKQKMNDTVGSPSTKSKLGEKRKADQSCEIMEKKMKLPGKPSDTGYKSFKSEGKVQ